MIRGGDISKGTCLLVKGQPFLVVEREFYSPGKGSAYTKVKMKSLRDGSVLTQTIMTQTEVEDAIVENLSCQFQYSDTESFHFMDNNTYDQYEVPISSMEEKKYYLKEGESYDLVMWEEEVIDIKVPLKMVFTVAESENYIRGDTVSGATKPIVTDTGLTIRVPLFIKQDEKILINTETNEYVERVNN